MVKPIQRVIIVVSGIAFLSSMGFMAASVWSGNTTSHNSPHSPQSVQEQLLAQESGYVAVLEREPDNALALQGLIQTRLALQKWEEAIEPLEILAEANPENSDVWQALTAVRIQLEDYEGAIASMKKLVELNPNNEELKIQLENLEAVAKGEIPESPENSSQPSE